MINPEALIQLPDDVLKAFAAFADSVDCGNFSCALCPYRLDKKANAFNVQKHPSAG